MADLLRLLDFLREGLLVCDATGRVVHANPALTRALEAEPERERLQGEMEALARCIASSAPDGDAAREAHAREVRTAQGVYRVRGTLVLDALSAPGSMVLVALDRLSPEPLPDEVLRERFGLTKTEIRIARLLAARRSNAEIAAELCLSPHTVRHHTERVLDKLGVPSRTQVGPAMLRDGGIHQEQAQR